MSLFSAIFSFSFYFSFFVLFFLLISYFYLFIFRDPMLELSTEIVPNVYIRFGETKSPNYFLDFYATACHATYFGAQFVFPFPLPFCSSLLPANKACVHTYKSSSPQILVYHFFSTNTMSRLTMQTLTLLNNLCIIVNSISLSCLNRPRQRLVDITYSWSQHVTLIIKFSAKQLALLRNIQKIGGFINRINRLFSKFFLTLLLFYSFKSFSRSR